MPLSYSIWQGDQQKMGQEYFLKEEEGGLIRFYCGVRLLCDFLCSIEIFLCNCANTFKQ